LFLEDDDYLSMLGLQKEIARSYSLTIYAFCLMPNHVHFLLSPKEDNLYDAMRGLFSRYAMRFNRKYERKGHLFGGPYRQAVCLDDSYLLAASLYIHLNPVKAGLVKTPQDYRWSSCRLYYEENVPRSFVDPDFVLNLLSEVDPERKQTFRLLLKKGAEAMTGYVPEQKDAVERFHVRVASLFPSLFRRVDERRQIAAFSGIDLVSSEELERQIEFVKTRSFVSKPSSTKAKKYLIEQLIARGFKRSEIAQRFDVSPKTVYNILKSSP
jgi:putative transposase